MSETIEARAARAGDLSPGPGRTPDCRLLVVEDDAATAKGLRLLLGREGRVVRTAGSVAAALAAAEAKAFDLVICDIGRPDGSGLELMRRLSARRPVRGSPPADTGWTPTTRPRAARPASPST